MNEPTSISDVIARYTPAEDEALNRAALGAVTAARKEAGLTQAGLSELLAWPRSKVADLETGRSRLLFADAIHLCIALNLDVGTMLIGTPESRMIRAQQAHRAALLFQAAAEAEGEDVPPLVVANPELVAGTALSAIQPALIVPHIENVAQAVADGALDDES